MSTAAVAPAPALGRPGRYRWMICALLFFGTTINYIDRQVIGILKPTLVQQFGWQDERIYAALVFTFQLAYAIGLLLAGRIMDKLGTRRGFAIAVGIWSVAAVGHAVAERMDWMKLPTVNLDAKTGLSVVLLTGAAAGFAIMRFLLGLGEAGNFPASIKTVAEWFPKKERALATGVFNSGTNVGAIITPLVVPWVTLHWGWEWAFVATGATLVLAVFGLFVTLFPDVMPSTIAAANSLTVHNASSTPYTLKVMTWVAVFFTPLVLLYQGWTYWVFRKRLSVEKIPA